MGVFVNVDNLPIAGDAREGTYKREDGLGVELIGRAPKPRHALPLPSPWRFWATSGGGKVLSDEGA